MSRQDDLELIRRSLLRRRRDLVAAHSGTRGELASLQDQPRDPEYEEGAQSAAAEYTLVTLTDSQRNELAQIDAALGRMEAGGYGECMDCGSEIPLERLQAVPFALRCAECAGARESGLFGPHHLPPRL